MRVGDIVEDLTTGELALLTPDGFIRNVGGMPSAEPLSGSFRVVSSAYEPKLVSVKVADALVEIGLCASKSEANRKIREGAVFIDGEKITGFTVTLDANLDYQVRLGYKQAVLSPIAWGGTK